MTNNLANRALLGEQSVVAEQLTQAQHQDQADARAIYDALLYGIFLLLGMGGLFFCHVTHLAYLIAVTILPIYAFRPSTQGFDMLYRSLAKAGFIAFCLTSTAIANAEVRYTVSDVGNLGISFGFPVAFDINSSGQITGYAEVATPVQTNDGPWYPPHAFLRSNGNMQDLGTLGGRESDGSGINNTGQVVGSSEIALAPGQTGDNDWHAFLYSNGSMQDLGTLGGTHSAANSINDAGQITGYSDTASHERHAFIYQNGTMTDIGTLGGGYSHGADINGAGQVAGTSYLSASAYQHAFIYADGVMTDLGSLVGVNGNSMAQAINNNGYIAGWSDTESGAFNSHAFLYDGSTMQDLGTLGGSTSQAEALNDAGHVVGSSNDASNNSRAFFYDGTVMTDLNTLIDPTLGWTLVGAHAINNNGFILAQGVKDGVVGALLLAPVPEPETYALMLAGFGLIGGAAYRRRGRCK